MSGGNELMSVAQQASDDALKPLYYLIGSTVLLQLIGLIVGGIKFLFGRTVEREDKDKEDLKKKTEDHDKRFADLEAKFDIKLHELEEQWDEKFDEQARALQNTDRTLLGIQNDVKMASSAVDSLRGAITQLTTNLDNRLEKQSQFYRDAQKEAFEKTTDALEKLEFAIRQDMTRSIHDARLLGGKKPRS